MKKFTMCGACQAEYDDPNNRRFHAQPNACPECGPHIELWDNAKNVLASDQRALEVAANVIKNGEIVAVKGLGGFQLLVDARNNTAVARLRERKYRIEKPFALMYPTLKEVRDHCFVSETEERLLASAESPIVLLRRKENTGLSENVAPGNPYLGVMLAYTPLHIILMDMLEFPIIATSGNHSEEPICIDEKDAVSSLGSIVDVFLVHDRPIVRHVDDSIVRVIMGRELVIRRARGYAPLPITIKESPDSILAVGPHLKNTIALSKKNNVFISQHIGNLETDKAYKAFENTINDIERIYEINPKSIACDLHPEYLSTKWTKDKGLRTIAIQHHYAHILSCMAENEIIGPALGVSWDGTGYGSDKTIWGGEFLSVNQSSFERIACFEPFPLPGGEKAIQEPRRAAVGFLYQYFGEKLFDMKGLAVINDFDTGELQNIKTMLAKNINCPRTSSMGRIFDAVSALLGIRYKSQFEGQAAMELEFALEGINSDEIYPFEINDGDTKLTINCRSLVGQIISDITRGVETGIISAKFHNTLVETTAEIAERTKLRRVVLSGGCFQNKYLTEKCVQRLREEGFQPYWHQRVPPNDGGISLGQLVGAQRLLKK
jgi:hydrogenase maturation protein HypF